LAERSKNAEPLRPTPFERRTCANEGPTVEKN
jgi:hypothetical protein